MHGIAMTGPGALVTSGSPVVVLVVDDNPDHRTLIRLRLKRTGVDSVRPTAARPRWTDSTGSTWCCATTSCPA